MSCLHSGAAWHKGNTQQPNEILRFVVTISQWATYLHKFNSAKVSILVAYIIPHVKDVGVGHGALEVVMRRIRCPGHARRPDENRTEKHAC